MATIQRRFRVALSFPGEKREYVLVVAEKLAAVLGRESVLYDEYLAAELARPDLDLYLGMLYREQSDLLVPFLCGDYIRKKWCNLEWRQLRDILFALEGDRIMPLRFDDAPIPGMLAIDGYVTISVRAPEEVADLILHRLCTAGYVGNGSVPGRSEPSGSGPGLLERTICQKSIFYRPQRHTCRSPLQPRERGPCCPDTGTGRHGRHR